MKRKCNKCKKLKPQSDFYKNNQQKDGLLHTCKDCKDCRADKDEIMKRTWYAMKNRCYNKNSQGYKNYGARGIGICYGWLNSFDSFKKDMGYRPKDHSIDRIDNNGGYWCGHCDECIRLKRELNCRWADKYLQAKNRRIYGSGIDQKTLKKRREERVFKDLFGCKRSELKQEEKDAYKYACERLTTRQKQVFKLFLEGLTQERISDKYDLSQTTIHKTLRGNIDYGNNGKRYGGLFKKLKRYIKEYNEYIDTESDNIYDLAEELNRDVRVVRAYVKRHGLDISLEKPKHHGKVIQKYLNAKSDNVWDLAEELGVSLRHARQFIKKHNISLKKPKVRVK
jgi:DNA-binding CsgD family transcriptional regulator